MINIIRLWKLLFANTICDIPRLRLLAFRDRVASVSSAPALSIFAKTPPASRIQKFQMNDYLLR